MMRLIFSLLFVGVLVLLAGCASATEDCSGCYQPHGKHGQDYGGHRGRGHGAHRGRGR